MTMKSEEICNLLDGLNIEYKFYGNKNDLIQGFCSINNLKQNSITWAKTSEKILNVEELRDKGNLLVINLEGALPIKGINYIDCPEPKKCFFKILDHLFVRKNSNKISLHSNILTKSIGKGVSIGDFCYLCEAVVLEDGVKIGNHVSIECPTIIGKNSIIHSGVVIGTDGFGYYRDIDRYEKVPHFGRVVIGENVEIGANTCIDRGTIDDTVIGNGVKIDNLCHIAHNVVIEENSMVIACSLLGGSSILKKDSYIAPGAIIKNQVIIGEHAFVGMGAVVLKNVENEKIVAGVPAKVLRGNE